MSRNVVSHRTKDDARRVFPDYSATQSRIIGSGLIIIWPFAAICNGVGIADAFTKGVDAIVFNAGSGWWAPVPAFVAGGLALMAAKHKTKGFIRGAMATAVVSIPFDIALLMAGCFATAFCSEKERDRVRLVMGILYLVQSVLLIAMSIWLIVLSERTLSLCCRNCLKRSSVGTTSEPTIELQVRTDPADMTPSDMNGFAEAGLYPDSAECEMGPDMVKDGSTLDPSFLRVPDDQPPPYSEYTVPPKY